MLLLATGIAPTALLPILLFAPKVPHRIQPSRFPTFLVHRPKCIGVTRMSTKSTRFRAAYDGQGLNVTTCSYADHIGSATLRAAK